MLDCDFIFVYHENLVTISCFHIFLNLQSILNVFSLLVPFHFFFCICYMSVTVVVAVVVVMCFCFVF